MLKLHHEEAISETQMVQTAACQRTQVTQQVRCMPGQATRIQMFHSWKLLGIKPGITL